MKQTAAEWYAEQMQSKEQFTQEEFDSITNQAKEMEEQETIEEIAERYYEDEVSINAFINGYKLAQEQILGVLYEEITERRDYSASKMCEVVIDYIKQNK